jgi:hypothetical protein
VCVRAYLRLCLGAYVRALVRGVLCPHGNGSVRRGAQGMTASGAVMDKEEQVKGGDIMESSNTANNARTYCFQECCAPMAMDLCVKSAATEVTRSTKISRAEWTEEEHAAGHVLVGGNDITTSQMSMKVEGERNVNSKTGVKGDGSTTSQSAMEIEGERNVNNETGMKSDGSVLKGKSVNKDKSNSQWRNEQNKTKGVRTRGKKQKRKEDVWEVVSKHVGK